MQYLLIFLGAENDFAWNLFLKCNILLTKSCQDIDSFEPGLGLAVS